MDAAEDALHEMLETPGVSADAMAFCVLVDGYASRHGGTAAAEGVVNELLDRHATGQIQGEVSEWGLPAFGALMKGYRRDKDVTGAFGALQRMVEAGVVPDMAAIGGLLDVCIMTGRWKHAIGVVEAMLAAGMSPQQASQCRQLLRWLKEGERVAREKLYGRPTEAPEVERIKFWLGLPNQYYGDTNWP